MTRRMLIDATHPEQTRVAIVNHNRVDDLDLEYSGKKLLKGNIYLAKVMRIEPSLQAAFVEYGGNRHGFLAFGEIHPDYFRIPVSDRPAEAIEEPQEPLSAEDEQQIAELQAEGMGQEEDDDASPLDADPADAAAEAAPQQDLPSPLAADPIAVMSTSSGDDGHTLVTNLAPDGDTKLADVASDQTVEAVGGEVAEVQPERFVRQRRPRYKIQEVLHRRQVMLIQVVKEERDNKGAALTTFLSLAGRYCVLMPNTDRGGGVSRKITSVNERRRMKDILDQLEVPEGMAVILRTAGMEQPVAEIQRDLDYLLRLWNSIREQTLQSNAPALIYEEADLIKRSLRDLYSTDIQEVMVAGEDGYQRARNFIQGLVPDSVDSVRLYQDQIPLFFKFGVERQLESLHSHIVQLKSGGYIVINPTEALVSIDVNSGRATRERHIEETALKTNLEAAEEIARQLRLRDLAGLIVIDFIDMEDGRNNAAVERRLKDAMRNDRARLQIGRISHFGLLELSRQRLRPSMLETNFERCPHCTGQGWIRSIESAELSTLRAIEEEGIVRGGGDLRVHLPQRVALYILNEKRAALSEIEKLYDLRVNFIIDETLQTTACKIERMKSRGHRHNRTEGPAVNADQLLAENAAYSTDQNADDGSGIDLPMGMPHEELSRMSQRRDDQGNGDDRRDRNRSRGRDRGRGRYRDRNDRNGGRYRDQNDNQFQQPSQQMMEQGAGDMPMDQGMEGADDQTHFAAAGMSPEMQLQQNDHGPQDFGQGRDDRGGGRRRGRRGGRGRGRDRNDRGGGRYNQDRGPYESQTNRSPQGSYQQSSGGQWTQRQPDSQGHASQMPQQPVNIPLSIHDIDTTPRDTPMAAQTAAHEQANDPPQPSSYASQFETVNQAPEKPRGGWWRRITGQ